MKPFFRVNVPLKVVEQFKSQSEKFYLKKKSKPFSGTCAVCIAPKEV
jgi:hypothetical protein